MKNAYLQAYRQPKVELLVMSTSGICAGSGDTTFKPSHFDDNVIEW